MFSRCLTKFVVSTGFALSLFVPQWAWSDVLQAASFPASALNFELQTLPAPAQQRALDTLGRVAFSSADIPFLHVDASGAVYIEDHFTVPEQYEEAAIAQTPSVAQITEAEAFALHSKPGSSKVVYLDFNGHVITGTAWNSSSGVITYNALAYDTNGNAASFSAAELASIASIWRRVAEDYAPFDIDVTTQEPASFTTNTGRILITKNTDAGGVAMPASTAGGVAYVDVWGKANYATYSPALVYYNNLGGGRSDYVTEAASHELGHNLSLGHHGTSSSGYYDGHGSGFVSWGPIMGTGYDRHVSQWSKGEYTGANNSSQDDIANITARLTVRSDDHSDAASGASMITFTDVGNIVSTTPETDAGNSQASNKGIIQSRTDVDVFYFDTIGGSTTLKATPLRESANMRGGNLDVQLTLKNSLGNVVSTVDPTDDTHAEIATTLAAGRYYLFVEGVGNATSPYSDYGSIGQYFLSGSVPISDADGDGVADINDDPGNDPKVATPADLQGGKITITAPSNLMGVTVLPDSDSSLPSTGKPASTSYTFPDGVIQYRVSVAPFGATITVTLTFPSAIPANSKVYKITSGGGYVEFLGAQILGNQVTLTLTDGGAGDSDGVANGTIVDPVAVAVPVSSGGGGGSSGGGGGGGGGSADLFTLFGLMLALLLGARKRLPAYRRNNT